MKKSQRRLLLDTMLKEASRRNAYTTQMYWSDFALIVHAPYSISGIAMTVKVLGLNDVVDVEVYRGHVDFAWSWGTREAWDYFFCRLIETDPIVLGKFAMDVYVRVTGVGTP